MRVSCCVYEEQRESLCMKCIVKRSVLMLMVLSVVSPCGAESGPLMRLFKRLILPTCSIALGVGMIMAVHRGALDCTGPLLSERMREGSPTEYAAFQKLRDTNPTDFNFKNTIARKPAYVAASLFVVIPVLRLLDDLIEWAQSDRTS
jgi:hypothetical protein